MKICKNAMVGLALEAKTEQGDVIESVGQENEMFQYIHGYGVLLPALEAELEGKEPKDEFSVTLTPDKAYGEYNPKLLVKAPREKLPEDLVPEVNQSITATRDDGSDYSMIVREVTDDYVVLDANNPLAGITIEFNVKVRLVREANKKDLKSFGLLPDDKEKKEEPEAK